jgi:predicted Zn finger-like uncharacterized protein
MSLATRCTSCGTIFRVVQDQLKVSEGWVRCGRCQHVFNALQNLFDLDREQPPPWPPAPEPESETPTWAATQPLGADLPRPVTPAAPPSPAGASPRAPAGTTPPPATTAPRVAPPPSPARAAAAPAMAGVGAGAPRSYAGAAAPAAAVATAPSSTALLQTASREVDAAADTEGLSTQPEHAQPDHDDGESSGFLHARFNLDLVQDRSQAAAAIAAVHAPSGALTEPAPLFVRQADRAARWRQPRVRAALGLLLVLLVLTLLGQIALQFRNPIAAAWPDARGLLQSMCEQFDCRIEPPRRLESLTVDASGLTSTPTSGVYRLSVALHNHSHTLVMVPAIDLSLTDAQGRVFARRTLLPQDLNVAQATPASGTAAHAGQAEASIGPGADLTLQALLSTGADRVVGYTVEIFYP